MWKILYISFLCQVIFFIYVAEASFYEQHVKVTELVITPNNGLLDYNEETGELNVITSIGINSAFDIPLYYNYFYDTESDERGAGTERICGNRYREYKREDQRIHASLVLILRGEERCPFRKGESYKVDKEFSFTFYDSTNGILINCGNNTAEATLTGTNRLGNIGNIAFTYYLTGEKCNK